MRNILLYVSLALPLLTSCGGSQPLQQNYPADLMVKGKALKQLNNASYDDTVDYTGYCSLQYNTLAIRHNGLVDVVQNNQKKQ